VSSVVLAFGPLQHALSVVDSKFTAFFEATTSGNFESKTTRDQYVASVRIESEVRKVDVPNDTNFRFGTLEVIGFLPDGVPLWAAVALIAVSLITSLMTAAFGIGGGVTLLGAMTVLMPVAAIIPVHGLVQLGSNASRAAIFRNDMDFRLLIAFTLGTALGVGVGVHMVVALPDDILRLVLGAFVLATTWIAMPKRLGGNLPLFTGLGALASLATMFVGATGPLVMALVAPLSAEKKRVVANFAGCMTVQHGAKTVAFGVIGFAFAEWAPLILAMIASGFVGTLIGRKILLKIRETIFRNILKWLMTALALNLIITALWRLT